MSLWLFTCLLNVSDLSLDNLGNLLFDDKLYHFRVIDLHSNFIKKINYTKLPHKEGTEYLITNEQYEEITKIADEKRKNCMEQYTNQIYYLGISYEDYDRNNVISFFDTTREHEYVVKIIRVTNTSNYDERQIELKIVKDMTNPIDELLNIPNKILECDHIIYVSDNHKWLNNNGFVSREPICYIDDGGSLNCGGGYKSLFIPIDEYNKIMNEINNKKQELLSINEMNRELLLNKKYEIENEISIINNKLQHYKLMLNNIYLFQD